MSYGNLTGSPGKEGPVLKRFAVRAFVEENDPNLIYTKPTMFVRKLFSGIPAWPKETETVQNKKKFDAVMGVLGE